MNSAPAIAMPQAEARPAWLPTWRRLSRNIPAMIGLVIVVLLVFTGIFGPMLAPYSYAQQDLDNVRAAPSPQHWLGTDDLGRDMLTRLIYGARSVLFVIVVTTALEVTLALPLGALAGYYGGWWDRIISRLSDFLFAFPGLLFIFFIAATVKPAIIAWMRTIGLEGFVRSGYADYLVVMVALGIVGWAGLARLVRGQVLALREKDFVLSARAVGVPGWRIMFRYLIPNALSPIIVALSMGMGGIALAEGYLSYLGIGLQPPNPSWGNIIADNAPVHWRDWPAMIWLVLAPGLVLALVVFAFNFLGDGLDEALNPELS
jgi:ABC-type dipeptide/oligopeptide/nickel transport system permease subunit